ncbi:MAG: MlaD family protein [Nocardioides sp.]|uniref:MlaD family protein n=1 Tax=Nocardioides sp. TaxID=35761 RepID=UPI002390E146|nr:MlaD family protein [Nocardioides sp.]MDE0775868.1 MlaD family protein [Nocardioides sp.]
MTGRISRTWGRLRHTPGLGRDVLTLTATVVVGLIVAGYLLAHQRAAWPWKDDQTVHAQLTNAPAISPGNGQEVRIAGVPVGTIVSASVTEEGEADLTLEIDREYEVYQDARLVLRPKSPLNEIYIELYPGTEAAGRLDDGGTIASSQTAAPIQQDAVLEHLDDKTRAAFTSLLAESDNALATAPADLAPGLRATNTTLQNLGQVSDALDSRREALATLVTNLGVVVQAVGHDDTRLAGLATKAQSTLNVLDEKNAELNASLAALPGFEDSLNSSTAKITELSAQLKPTLDNVQRATDSLPTALTKLTGTLDELADLSTVAGPLVTEARPLARDLRPFVKSADESLVSLRPFTTRLDSITQRLVSSLDYRKNGQLGYLQDFLYNTTSVGSLNDGNGGIFRAEFVESFDALIPTLGRAQ